MMTPNALDFIAYDLLSRDDIFELRATRDAIELADLLINTAPDDTIALMPISADDELFDLMIFELRTIMTDMILNPID